jgi:hypothetical protein
MFELKVLWLIGKYFITKVMPSAPPFFSVVIFQVGSCIFVQFWPQFCPVSPPMYAFQINNWDYSYIPPFPACFVEMKVSLIFCSRLPSNHNPLDFYLLTTWNYRHEISDPRWEILISTQ